MQPKTSSSRLAEAPGKSGNRREKYLIIDSIKFLPFRPLLSSFVLPLFQNYALSENTSLNM